MAGVPQDDAMLFAAYRRELETREIPAGARTASVLAFLINSGFMLLDYVSFPEHFEFFLAMRLGLSAVFVATYFAAAKYPRASTWSICISLGIVMLTMIFTTGGSTSPYFGGLMLLFLAMGVVLPLSGIEAAVLSGVMLLPYLVSPWLETGPVDWATCRIYSIFLISAAAESVGSSTYLDRMRFKDFIQRIELKDARDHLEELDRAKSRFTANIHHELRTPLTLTLAPIEGMLCGEFGDISDVQRRYLKTAESNALRLLKLINNLLDLAKLESHQMTIHRGEVETPKLIEGIIENVRPLTERKGIDLVLECTEEIPTILADAEALEKIVINLLGNALKFTERDGTICLELEPDPGEGGIVIGVSDTGIGIAPDELDRIFDRFAQVDASGTRKHEGTGIGLSLCQELVELHGGRIWAESEGQGHGTRVSVWLPLNGGAELGVIDAGDSTQEHEETFASHQLVAGFAAESHLKQEDTSEGDLDEGSTLDRDDAASEALASEDMPEIVVAEDNDDMRGLLEHLLGRHFRVRLACNGREALEMVRERAPALVLSDVMMPEMTGIELCRELKSDAETRSIPLILVTSKAERSMKVEGLELGADDYVTKPFHPRELMARVRSSVNLYLVKRELEERNRQLEIAGHRIQSALTELKETQVELVQREHLAGLGELAAGVAHEANNPLNFAANANRALNRCLDDTEDILREIMGLEAVGQSDDQALVSLEKIRRLCRERDFQESAELLRELSGIIEEGIGRTTKLVGDLRAFAGSGAMREETLDVLGGLRSTLKLMSHSMRELQIEVVIEAEDDLPLPIGDPRALNQVFLNLMKNARDAMAAHGGTIRVDLSADEEFLVVRVRDQGHGVLPEVRQTLFEPFCTTKRPGEGSGLGLSVSRNILYGMGGSLSLVETSKQGTEFEIRLRVVDDR
jgi:signal transduction histidine kinase